MRPLGARAIAILRARGPRRRGDSNPRRGGLLSWRSGGPFEANAGRYEVRHVHQACASRLSTRIRRDGSCPKGTPVREPARCFPSVGSAAPRGLATRILQNVFASSAFDVKSVPLSNLSRLGRPPPPRPTFSTGLRTPARANDSRARRQLPFNITLLRLSGGSLQVSQDLFPERMRWRRE